MSRRLSRRQVVAAGAVILGVGSRLGEIRPAAAAETKVRMTMGLRATVQSIPWIGAEAGIFRRHRLLVEFPALEVGGLESAEFSQTGTVPLAEEVLKGNDTVILLRNALPHVGIFVMTRREFTNLRELDGRKVGVLTNVTSGQAGINTRLAVEHGRRDCEVCWARHVSEHLRGAYCRGDRRRRHAG